MQNRKEERLVELFRKMNAKDQDAALAFVAASVRENPKQVPQLRLVASNGRRAA